MQNEGACAVVPMIVDKLKKLFVRAPQLIGKPAADLEVFGTFVKDAEAVRVSGAQSHHL